MILWFAGLSLVCVWLVFRDPALDHRLVVAGALLPDAIDGSFLLSGKVAPWPAHSVTANAALLVAVMVASRGRRRLRRQLLAVPIGSFLHLVLDGVWTDIQVFWWPLYGSAVGRQALPSDERGLLNVPLEVAGLAALVWIWRRFGLAQPARRAHFLRTGRVSRDVVG